jgi:tripartite-type tricarboxylate transporter receptor subunit TctC
VPAMFDTLTSSAGHIKAGALRALATGGAERAATLPDVPTFIELGYQDMRFTSWFGLCTPAGLPAPILAQLNAALIESLRDATVRDRFTETSFTPQPMTPPQFTEFVRSETVRWAAMIKQVGATAE